MNFFQVTCSPYEEVIACTFSEFLIPHFSSEILGKPRVPRDTCVIDSFNEISFIMTFKCMQHGFSIKRKENDDLQSKGPSIGKYTHTNMCGINAFANHYIVLGGGGFLD